MNIKVENFKDLTSSGLCDGAIDIKFAITDRSASPEEIAVQSAAILQASNSNETTEFLDF